MANTLANIYRDDQIAQKVQATENAAVWLSGRVSELQTELEQRQREITTLRTQRSLVSAESLQALNTQSVELQQNLQSAQAELDDATRRSTAMEAVIDGTTAEKAAAVQDSQLSAIQAAIERGDTAAAIRFDRRFESLRLQASAEAARLGEQVAELEAEARRLSSQFEEQSSALANLQELERETEAVRILYETFLTRLKETTVQEGVHQADSRILSEATPGQMVAPRKSRILALSMILGIMAGSALVLLRNTPKTLPHGRGTGTRDGQTVLGQIPRIPAKGRPATISISRPNRPPPRPRRSATCAPRSFCPTSTIRPGSSCPPHQSRVKARRRWPSRWPRILRA